MLDGDEPPGILRFLVKRRDWARTWSPLLSDLGHELPNQNPFATYRNRQAAKETVFCREYPQDVSRCVLETSFAESETAQSSVDCGVGA